jgi:hypothetical protein
MKSDDQVGFIPNPQMLRDERAAFKEAKAALNFQIID